MKSASMNNLMAAAHRALGLIAGALMLATAASAQTAPANPNRWRVGASTGAYVPFSSLIVRADSRDTHLEAGPAFLLDLQFQARNSIAVFANGFAAFGSVQLGSSIRPAVLGPSSQVVLAGGTAGVLLAATDWLGEHLQPTLRLGGGFKWYSFDLIDADSQVRPTGDIGVGLRGIGLGAIDVTAELRYLPSSFDQGKLPIRGIAAQDQRQTDIVFAIGIGIRP